MFVVDGMNLLLLGVHRSKSDAAASRRGRALRDGDLRKLLAVVEWLLHSNMPFKVCFDSTADKALPDEQRDLYDLLISEHNAHFEKAPTQEADIWFLAEAATKTWAVLSNDKFNKKNTEGVHWFDLHPWLKEPGRLLHAVLKDENILLSRQAVIKWDDGTAFDYYDRILPFLLSVE